MKNRYVGLALGFLLMTTTVYSEEGKKTLTGLPRVTANKEIPNFKPSDFGFKKGSIVLETRILEKVEKENRALVLWMTKAKKIPDRYESDDVYLCPDQSRGSYYSGKAHLSLVDIKLKKNLNSVNIPGLVVSDFSGKVSENDVEIPYKIRPGYAYSVLNGNSETSEVRPVVMYLKDYTGQGKPLQFALFSYEGCSRLDTLLAGYDEDTDRALVYYMDLLYEGKHLRFPWVDRLFAEKPIKPGSWKYEMDYREDFMHGGGCIDKYSFTYDPKLKQFKGSCIQEGCVKIRK